MEDLYITVQPPEPLTAVHLPPNLLSQMGTHLFIKSHEWGTIYIDLTDDIPMGCLKNMYKCAKDIKVNAPEVLTDQAVELLAELYPNLSGKIRQAYLFGGDVRGLLP